MRSFLQLDENSLASLAAALRRGELNPATPGVLRAYCPAELLEAISQTLSDFRSQGFTSRQLAEVLDLICEDRILARQIQPKLDLVWSGPEPERFIDRDTAVVVMDLFRTAKKSVLLSSYALFGGEEILEPLHQRMKELPALKVQMFLDVKRLPADQRSAAVILSDFKSEFLKKHWPWEERPEVFYDPRALSLEPSMQASLHAKVVVVDEVQAFLTSANLTTRAQNRNIEAGVLISSPSFAKTTALQFKGLIEHELVKRLL